MRVLSALGSALSRFVHAVFFSAGDADMSVSARAYLDGEILGDPVWSARRRWIDRILGADHCAQAWAQEVRGSLVTVRAAGLID